MVYATFVMKNEHFIPGAMMFAYGLRKQGIQDPIFCFVTEDVSSRARRFLGVLFDKVIEIQTIKTNDSNIEKRDDRAFLFTRFEIFKYAASYGIEKILIADSDILPLRQYQSLSQKRTPSAIINEKKEYATPTHNHQYQVTEQTLKTGEWKWHEVYKDYLDGRLIPKPITDRVLEDSTNIGMNTSLLIVSPTLRDYDAIQKDLNDSKIISKIKTFQWPEMQYLTYKWSGLWRTIDLRYASFSGYPRIDLVHGIHYAGNKPWAIQNKSFKHYSKFKDFRVWHHLFIAMMDEYPNLMEYPKLIRLYDTFTKLFESNPWTQAEEDHVPNWT